MRVWGAVVLSAVLAVACVGSAEPAIEPTPDLTTTAPAPSPSLESPREDPPPHPVSIEALIEKEVRGRNLRVRRELSRNDSTVRSLVTYRAGTLRISGLLVVPNGDGPYPVIVLAHGYIDPEVYTTGRGFERSQPYLASRGYAVLHVDYRNHATSDDDPANDRKLRLGYIEDVIAAVQAVKRSDLPYLDPERIGLLGRSMGGGVALGVAVVRPDIVDAIAVFAPISSDAVDNFERWIRRPGRRDLARAIIDRYGEPDEHPSFWRNASPRTYFERVSVPLMIHHGTDDDSVPIRWSRATVRALRRAGKDVTFHVYPGEGHSFGPAYPGAMDRTISFFRRHLG